MPRSFQRVIEEGIKDSGAFRESFIQQQEEKAPRRKPKRIGLKPKAGTLFAVRNKRLAIREAALRKVQIAFSYRKTTTGELKKYVAAPYSYRYRKLAVGRRKMLYAYDMDEKHIKSFALREIKNVAITDRKFRPKWSVEIL